MFVSEEDEDFQLEIPNQAFLNSKVAIIRTMANIVKYIHNIFTLSKTA